MKRTALGMSVTFIGFGMVTALAASQSFTIKTAVGEQPFDMASASVNVGCEENGTATVAYNAPTGSEIIEAQARWTDASNIKSMDAAVIDKQTAHAQATGTIRGLDKQEIAFGVKNCPGGGHATLHVYGRIKQTAP